MTACFNSTVMRAACEARPMGCEWMRVLRAAAGVSVRLGGGRELIDRETHLTEISDFFLLSKRDEGGT